jgi:two-component system LytT family response regulator
MISKRLGEVEDELPESIFFRTHNSFIVNITKIKHVDIKRGGYITLISDFVIPIAQRKVKEFMLLLKWDN